MIIPNVISTLILNILFNIIKAYDDLIRVEVLDLFSTQYIRGLSKLIVDIEYEELIYGEDN